MELNNTDLNPVKPTSFTEEQWAERIAKIEAIMEDNIARKVKPKIYGFLDFDGVINVFPSPGTPQYERLLEQQAKDFQFSDPDCVKRLSDFCIDYDMDIIISSSWRYSGLDFCKDYMYKGGFSKKARIIDTTDLEIDFNRELHITDYLLEHTDYLGYLIFDDLMMPHLTTHLVKCETLSGYTAERDIIARAKMEVLLARIRGVQE